MAKLPSLAIEPSEERPTSPAAVVLGVMRGIPGIPPPVSPAMSDTVDSANPFEGTWGVLRALKTEVRQLQAALHAEQQLREEEVGRLRREVQECQEHLAQEKAQRKAELQRFGDPITDDLAKLRDDMKKARASREREATELREAVEDEVKDRSKDVRELLERIGAEETARADDVRRLSSGLGDAWKQLESTGLEARQCFQHLAQDVKHISDHMMRVNNTWQSFRSDCLVSPMVPMHTMNPRPPDASRRGSRPVSAARPGVNGMGAELMVGMHGSGQ